MNKKDAVYEAIRSIIHDDVIWPEEGKTFDVSVDKLEEILGKLWDEAWGGRSAEE